MYMTCSHHVPLHLQCVCCLCRRVELQYSLRCVQHDWVKKFCLSAGQLGSSGAIAWALYYLGDGAGCHVALQYVTAEVPALQEVLVRVFQASLPAAISGGTTGSAIMSKLAGRRGTLSLQVLLCCAASAENLTCDA